ncbi:RNA polymerase sigma factor [Lysobacter sp. A3-1-A15]|uniref:RNA polymerase sigma factor n=1 Tax=Novilysobacter viscosus TaxID=3098602 RepID=UPI0039833C8A
MRPYAAGEAAGDGFEAFVQAQRPILVGYLCRRVPEEDAKDIAQEALVRMLRYRAYPQDQLKALMYRIATNVMLDRARRERSRGAPLHVSLDGEHDAMPSDEPPHEERLASQQALEDVRAAILQLPDRCREVYLLNRIEGMSYPAIARHCGISVKAVEKNIGRALRLLRERLAQHHRQGGDR